MFLRILYFIVSMLAAGAITYVLFSVVEKLYIVPHVCKYSIGYSQRYLIANGRGFFEPSVKAAVSTEHYKRTTRLLQIDLSVALALGILIPSSLSFWIVPTWAIKIGAVIGVLVDTFVSFVTCGNTDSQVGSLESADSEEGKYCFKGNWMPDFNITTHTKLDDEDIRCMIGRPFIVVDYQGFFCSAPLDIVILNS